MLSELLFPIFENCDVMLVHCSLGDEEVLTHTCHSEVFILFLSQYLDDVNLSMYSCVVQVFILYVVGKEVILS